MYSKRHLIVPLALSLGAFSQGTFAVSNIDSCRTITSSGSFRLTRNLTANGDCLVIQANNVSINLQGHTLTGNGTGAGVTAGDDTLRSGIAIRNGVVTNFSDGIDLAFVQGAVVEGVRAIPITDIGIRVGEGSVVSASVVVNVNDAPAIQVQCPSAVIGNAVTGSGIGVAFIDFLGANCEDSQNAPPTR
ncbi:MAG: hypothetical protein ACHBNF_04955 [Chromatiales bacterium]